MPLVSYHSQKHWVLVKRVDVWTWVSLGGARSGTVAVVWHGEQSVWSSPLSVPSYAASLKSACRSRCHTRQAQALALQGKNSGMVGYWWTMLKTLGRLGVCSCMWWSWQEATPGRSRCECIPRSSQAGVQEQGAGRCSFSQGHFPWLACDSFSLCPLKVISLCIGGLQACLWVLFSL